ncbi:MAG TPA: carbohydrate-binding family 9-like protein [Chthoniobacteraceae bacterium]|jgi:hypothetical protein
MIDLPRIECAVRGFGPVSAQAEVEPWLEIPAAALRETARGIPPAQATFVQVGRTEEELRVLFSCEDAHPSATLTERDAALYEEEVVEVFIDSVGDLESYYELELNPLNTVLDLVLRRTRSGYRKDARWDCDGLRTAVQRTAAGWNAELAIPFLSVASAIPQRGDEWRVNFFRIDRPPNAPRELSAWSVTGRPLFHVPERFGFIGFV